MAISFDSPWAEVYSAERPHSKTVRLCARKKEKEGSTRNVMVPVQCSEGVGERVVFRKWGREEMCLEGRRQGGAAARANKDPRVITRG